MAKNRKFTVNEKKIYRLGYLNGQQENSIKLARANTCIAEQARLLNQLDDEQPIRHIKLSFKEARIAIKGLKSKTLSNQYIGAKLQKRLSKAEQQVTVNYNEIIDHLVKKSKS